MSEKEFKIAIVIYLNGNKLSASYEPLYGRRRIAEKYGDRDKEILNDLNGFFSRFPEPNWKTQNVSEYMRLIENYAQEKFEWVNPTLAKAISNYFAYQWK